MIIGFLIRRAAWAETTMFAKAGNRVLLIDAVPIELHSRIKVACAEGGLKMADVLRDLLERKFPALQNRKSGKS